MYVIYAPVDIKNNIENVRIHYYSVNDFTAKESFKAYSTWKNPIETEVKYIVRYNTV